MYTVLISRHTDKIGRPMPKRVMSFDLLSEACEALCRYVNSAFPAGDIEYAEIWNGKIERLLTVRP